MIMTLEIINISAAMTLILINNFPLFSIFLIMLLVRYDRDVLDIQVLTKSYKVSLPMGETFLQIR
jgi:hypothetical protein